MTFSCDDLTSGVASCTSPVVVSAEGGGQSVIGTATDRAGNSATASVPVNIDETPPAITVSVSPAANINGWIKTDATVSFSCSDALSGIASCPTSQVITAEGARQGLSGTAYDVAGNASTSTATVSIDKTPPALKVASPQDGASVDNARQIITGTVSDALSGLASVSCDGAAATLSADAFTCAVTLAAGVNLISIQAQDNAGNTTSTPLNLNLAQELTPPPTYLLITPNSMTIVVGQSRRLALVDSYGRTITGATWSVSDLNIAQVTADGSTLFAQNVGQATITATFQDLSAQAQVNVLQGPSLPQRKCNPGLPLRR